MSLASVSVRSITSHPFQPSTLLKIFLGMLGGRSRIRGHSPCATLTDRHPLESCATSCDETGHRLRIHWRPVAQRHQLAGSLHHWDISGNPQRRLLVAIGIALVVVIFVKVLFGLIGRWQATQCQQDTLR